MKKSLLGGLVSIGIAWLVLGLLYVESVQPFKAC